MSDTAIAGIATAVCTLLGTVFAGYMTYLMAKLNKKADQAAVLVAVTADKLEAKDAKADKRLNGIESVVQTTHALVNSNMQDQLDLNAKMARRLANLTKLPEDELAAQAAELLALASKAKQAVADVEKPAVGDKNDLGRV